MPFLAASVEDKTYHLLLFDLNQLRIEPELNQDTKDDANNNGDDNNGKSAEPPDIRPIDTM